MNEHMSERDFAWVVSEHRAPLTHFVRRLVFGDAHLAEDIVQEALLRAWQRPALLASGHESIRPWLHVVARNLVNDHGRRLRSRPTEVHQFDVADLPTTSDEMDDMLLAQDMRTALARLSEDHREVLVAVYYRGLRLADVAAELGVPLGTVKSRLYYAMRALRLAVDRLGIRHEEAATCRGPIQLARAS